MRKVLYVLVLLAMVAACRPAPTPTPTPTPAPETPAPAKPVTLTFAHPTWFRDYPRYKEHYIPEFEKLMAEKGTPVKIELVEYPAPDDPYKEKLVLDLAAGQAPDIFLSDTFWIGEFVEAGYLLDITDKVTVWEWDKWVEAAKGAVTYKGKVWGLNRDTDVRPLYYRKDIFEKAGLPVPWQPKSWDDILEAARTIKEKVPDVYPIAIKSGKLGGEATTMQGFYMLLLGAGGRLYNAETGKWIAKSPAILDTLKFYATIYKEDLSVPPDFWLAGSPVDKAHELLRDGKIAIFPTWDGVWYDTGPGGKWEIPNRDEVLGYAKMPAKEPGAGIRGQDFVTISGGWCMTINAKTKNPDLAWEFLKFVYSKEEVLNHLLEYPGGLPARKDVAEDSRWKESVDEYTIWRAAELVPLTTFRPPLPVYPKVSEAVQTATENILLGKSPEEALEIFARDVSKAVGKENTEEIEVPTAKPVTLTFAHPTWFRDYPRYKEHYIPEFEKLMAEKGTPVKIELVEYPAPDDPYKEKLVLDLAAGQAPDIFLSDTFWIGEFVEAGYLLDITDKVTAWEWDKWVEAAKGAVTYKGRVWALNRDTDVRPLYYRKDIFEKAGLPVPWQPKSWDDILEAARTIKEKVPDVYPIALKAGVLGGEATTMQGFYMVLLGAGGRLYDAETGKWVAKSPAILDALKFYYTIYIEEELSMPPDFWLAGSPVDKAHELLRDGKLAIFPTWDGVWYDTGPGGKWEIPNRDEVLGYAKMPAKEPGTGIRGQDFVTISGGWSMAIYAKTEHPDLAWEFLKFVYSKEEVLNHLLEYPGGLPARRDVAEDPKWQESVDEYTIWRATELVPLTTFRPPLPVYPKVSEAVQTATENILLGKSPEEALEIFAKDVKKYVGAENTEEQ